MVEDSEEEEEETGFDFLSFHARLPVTFSSALKAMQDGSLATFNTRWREGKKRETKINK